MKKIYSFLILFACGLQGVFAHQGSTTSYQKEKAANHKNNQLNQAQQYAANPQHQGYANNYQPQNNPNYYQHNRYRQPVIYRPVAPQPKSSKKVWKIVGVIVGVVVVIFFSCFAYKIYKRKNIDREGNQNQSDNDPNQRYNILDELNPEQMAIFERTVDDLENTYNQ